MLEYLSIGVPFCLFISKVDMDSVTSFIYVMSMMFFSMMAFLFYLTSSLDMMIIPFYSFVLMDLVKPGWFRWLKALMLELPFLLLPVFYIFTHNIIWFYVLSVWGAIYGC